MINSNELRIGNWIMKEGEQFQVTPYTFLIVERDPDQFEPITLTEEWLFKMGFKVNMTGSAYWNETEFLIGLDEEGKFFYGEWEYDSDNNPFVNHILDLNSVHQLQNLYFALVMEELNIAG